MPAENTVAAFDLCVEAGCDGFEFDVRQTSDNRLVVCHDPRFRGRLLAETPFSRLSSLPVPCLADVLQRFSDTAFLDIELKTAGTEAASLKLLRTFPPSRGFVISSFLPEVLERLHALDATLPLGIIYDRTSNAHDWQRLPVTHVMPQFKLLTREMLRELRLEGKSVMPWTVNSPEDMQRLAEWGVDALISDDPRLLRGVLGGSNG